MKRLVPAIRKFSVQITLTFNGLHDIIYQKITLTKLYVCALLDHESNEVAGVKLLLKMISLFVVTFYGVSCKALVC
jgi:hypothetical protein